MATPTAATLRALDRGFDAIRRLDPGRLVPRAERHRTDVRALGEDGFLRIDGRTYAVVEVSRYTESDEEHARLYPDETWTELRLLCIETGESVHLEWEEDDEVEVSLSERTVSFSDLTDETGAAVDEDDLDAAADEEDSFFLEGTEFRYDDDYAAVFERGGSRSNAYFWEFRSRDGRWLTVEEWQSAGREEYEIWVSRSIDPDGIEILSPGR